MKSISRYVFIVGGGAFQDVLKIIFVSPYLWWSQNTLLAQLLSKRQSSLDDSYRAWMLRYIQMILSLFIVANTSTITYTKHSKYHGKSKYIDTKYYFIWDIIVQVQIVIKHISTHEIVVDPFTKPLPRVFFWCKYC
jgi:hypothetical protein